MNSNVVSCMSLKTYPHGVQGVKRGYPWVESGEQLQPWRLLVEEVVESSAPLSHKQKKTAD